MIVYFIVSDCENYQSKLDEIGMAIECYYSNHDCKIVFVGDEVNLFCLRGLGALHCAKLDNNSSSIDMLLSLLSTMSCDKSYIRHDLNGKLVENLPKNISLSDFELKFFYDLNKEDAFKLLLDPQRESLTNNILSGNYKAYEATVNKVNRELSLIVNELRETFVASSFNNANGINALLSNNKDIIDYKVFECLRTDVFNKKLKSFNSVLYKSFLIHLEILILGIVNNKPNFNNGSNRSLFNNYKSISCAALYLSRFKREIGLANASFVTAFRALEFYISGYLLMSNDIVHEYGLGKGKNYIKDLNGNKIKGFGTLWGIFDGKKIISKKDSDDVGEYIKLRNYHLYGHGFSLNGNYISEEIFATVNSIIMSTEKSLPYSDRSWAKFRSDNENVFRFDIKKYYNSAVYSYCGILDLMTG